MARAEELKIEGPIERVEFLGRGCFHPHQLGGLGSAAVSYSCMWGPGPKPPPRWPTHLEHWFL